MRKKIEIEITKGIPQIEKLSVLCGRDLGNDQRKKCNIDELDNSNDDYIVIIPKNIVSINSSFFLGSFGKSVRVFKTKEKFLEKYEFSCNNNALLTITDGINDALNNVDALE